MHVTYHQAQQAETANVSELTLLHLQTAYSPGAFVTSVGKIVGSWELLASKIHFYVIPFLGCCVLIEP